MTLMKSLLLGSAAGIVGIASAQAADLPTRKGAPAAEYVRICSITVNGTPVVGWMLPGSDTCFKLSGYLTAQIEGGNIQSGQTLAYGPGGLSPVGTQVTTPTRGLLATGSTGRTDFGYNTRLNFGFDAVSNTAYGPLTAHAEMQFENGNGYGNDVGNPLGGSAAYLNLAYVTWAGITAGKAPSFYSFTGGGAGWYNFFSPDQQGFNQPDVLAYTASFGGGFSATIAAQSNGSNGASGGGTDLNGVSGNNFNGLSRGTDYSVNGQSIPDFVANLKVVQGWGSAQVSGVGHYVDVTGFNGLQQQVEGWGIDAGVSFNLPTFGAGDKFLVTGSLDPECGLVLRSSRRHGWRTRHDQRQRPADGPRRYLRESVGRQLCDTADMVGFGRNRPSLLASIRGFSRGQLWSGEMDGNGLQFGRLQQQQLARRSGRPLDSGHESRFRV